MININCFKTFQNYYKIVLDNPSKSNYSNIWSAQIFKAEDSSCITFIHHETLFYITLFEVDTEKFKSLNVNFALSVIEHLERYLSLTNKDVIDIKKYCSYITFEEKSNEKKVNTMLTNIITVIKALNLWNYENETPISLRDGYKDFEHFFDKADCKKFLSLIRK